MELIHSGLRAPKKHQWAEKLLAHPFVAQWLLFLGILIGAKLLSFTCGMFLCLWSWWFSAMKMEFLMLANGANTNDRWENKSHRGCFSFILSSVTSGSILQCFCAVFGGGSSIIDWCIASHGMEGITHPWEASGLQVLSQQPYLGIWIKISPNEMLDLSLTAVASVTFPVL